MAELQTVNIMASVLLWMSLSLFVGGIVLSAMGWMRRTDQCPPLFTFRPKHWRPVWKMRPWFTPVGFRLYVSGTVLIVAGAASVVWLYN